MFLAFLRKPLYYVHMPISERLFSSTTKLSIHANNCREHLCTGAATAARRSARSTKELRELAMLRGCIVAMLNCFSLLEAKMYQGHWAA
jgi:hypothetical protein